jgi:hypothetical protein
MVFPKGDAQLEAYVRNSLGLTYDTLADSQAALDNYNLALNYFHEKEIVSGEALVLEKHWNGLCGAG